MVLLKKLCQNGFNKGYFMDVALLTLLLLPLAQARSGYEVLLTNETFRDAAARVRMERQAKPSFLPQVCGGFLAVDPKNTTYIVSPLSDTTKVNCRWKIEAPFGKQIKFVFEFFRLSSTLPDCSDFYFDIKDVTGTQRYCHEGPSERSYVASGSTLEVTYYSSEPRQSDEGLRLRLEYGDVPCQAFFNNVARGNIFTPGYPSYYPDDRICTWRVQVPPGYLLQLSCDQNYFWIENSPFCNNDVLLLSLTGRVDFSDALKFCGRRGPYALVSLTNVITLLFKSNLYYHYRGFHCEFSAVPSSGGIFPTIPPTAIPPDPNSCGSCGVGNQPTVRVTGGTESAKNQFPWTVAILQSIRNNTALSQFCGGTILNDRYVLTAAHCVRGRTAAMLRVDVGDHNLTDSTESRAMIVRVASILVQPAYQSNPNNNVDNDIAILKLDRSLNFSQIARPVCLPSPGASLDGMTAVVAGWGKTSSTSSNSVVLRVGTVQVFPLSSCAIYGPQILTNNMICAGAPPGTPGILTDACPGDSGGPLTVFLGGQWYLIGVVSSGPPNNQCGVPNWPGLYTRVGNYIQWIVDNTRIDSTCSVQRNFNADAQTDIAALGVSSASLAILNNSLQTAKPSNRPSFGAIVALSDTNEISLFHTNKATSQSFPSLSASRPVVSPNASVGLSNGQVTVTRMPTFYFWMNNKRPSFLQPVANMEYDPHKLATHSGARPGVNNVPNFIAQPPFNIPSSSVNMNPPFMPFRARPPGSVNSASSVHLPWKLKHTRYHEIDLS